MGDDYYDADDLRDDIGGYDGSDNGGPDRAVIISRKQLDALRKQAAGHRPPQADLLDQIKAAENPDAIMKLLNDAGVATSWNRE